MNRSRLGEIAAVALLTAFCGCTSADSPEDGELSPRTVDVTALLARAGQSSNDHSLAVGMGEHELSCEADTWSIRAYYGPTRPPPIERILLVTWDMPAGVLGNGWELVKEEKDPSYWSLKLSAEEVGFGCEERYSTSFLLLAAWGDKISRPIGVARASPGALEDFVYYADPTKVEYSTTIDYIKAGLPEPEASTYYLQNLFTGTASSAAVAVKSAGSFSQSRVTHFDTNFVEIGLGNVEDVAAGVVYERDGVELTNHSLRLWIDRTP